MFELLGLVFGGVSRLAQHFMELRDKQKEREHEAVMYDKQIELADKKFSHDAALRTMDAQAADNAAEWEAMRAALQAQAQEAAAAGGWVAKLSAMVRPSVTMWLLALYTVAKVCTLYLSVKSGIPFAEVAKAAYTEFDGTLLASVMSFWFADRSLRRR
jgi:hypothetical protein